MNAQPWLQKGPLYCYIHETRPSAVSLELMQKRNVKGGVKKRSPKSSKKRMLRHTCKSDTRPILP